MSAKNQLLKIGDALWAGAVEGGRPNGEGELILPNGSVHKGSFVDGRANGAGEYFDATGMVTKGSWTDNKRVGSFTTIDPKGGEWLDTYSSDGKRTARKKVAAPADNGGAPALKCVHCAVKFHAAYNSCCRQHSGKWMQAEEKDGAVDRDEFPEGGMWLCCGSRKREGSAETCSLGVHASEAVEEVRLRRDDAGEVVLGSSGDKPREPQTDAYDMARCREIMEEAEWCEKVRACVLGESQPWVCDSGMVWLDTRANTALVPLASLAECGKTGCYCVRTIFPSVRKRFREEVARVMSAAMKPSSSISYVSLGSGQLLGDLDVLCALQSVGFTISSVALIDSIYTDSLKDQQQLCGSTTTTDEKRNTSLDVLYRPLYELSSYLGKETAVTPYTSIAEYAHARLQRKTEPAANVFVQIDCDEVSNDEAALLSAVALSTDGSGHGFRLANKCMPCGEVPMSVWKRITPQEEEADDPIESLCNDNKQGGADAGAMEVYESVRRVDISSLLSYLVTNGDGGSSSGGHNAAAESASGAAGPATAAATPVVDVADTTDSSNNNTTKEQGDYSNSPRERQGTRQSRAG